MRIDNPSISGSLSFIQGTNTISGTSVSLTGSLSGTFEGQFSGDSLSNISGAFDSVSSSLASDISLNAASITSLNSASSSYALESDISGAFDSVSSSLASNISLNAGSINSLNSASSSYLLNTTDTLDGDLTVTGKITAQEFHTEFVSASIIFESGSTKFGDSADDVHSFTGSLNLSGSLQATSLIKIGGTSTQFLKADGSIDSTGYLPLSGGNITGNLTVTGSLTGTLTTAAQTNITSLGTLSTLAVSGNLTVDTNTLVVDTVGDRVLMGAAAAIQGDSLEVHAKGNAGAISLFGRASDNLSLIAFRANGAATLKAAIEGGDIGLGLFTGTSERMRINSIGNVGIGTTAPGAKLTVQGGIQLYTNPYGSTPDQAGLPVHGETRYYIFDTSTSFQNFLTVPGTDATFLMVYRIGQSDLTSVPNGMVMIFKSPGLGYTVISGSSSFLSSSGSTMRIRSNHGSYGVGVFMMLTRIA